MAGRDEVARGYRIEGRVQGVGFRWWTRTQARRLGLSGSVRNRADGTVEVQAQGPAAAVEQFERLLREGPSGAKVVHLETFAVTAGGHDGFEILH